VDDADSAADVQQGPVLDARARSASMRKRVVFSAPFLRTLSICVAARRRSKTLSIPWHWHRLTGQMYFRPAGQTTRRLAVEGMPGVLA